MILYNEELPLKWYDVDNEVSVRKYEVDVKGLVKLLRQHKTLSNKEIAEKLDVTLTTVEHWFRQDKSFTVPDPNNWIKLKELLDIKDTSFDKSIMTFETKEGNFDKAKRIFDSNYLSPTILANDTEIKIISKV